MIPTITKIPLLSTLIAGSIVAPSVPAMKNQESKQSARTVRSRLKEIGNSTLRILCLGAIALSILLPVVGWAAPLDTWHWRNPIPQGHTLESVAYGNNTFVAVGDSGTILTSPDGVNWTTSASGTTSQLRGVAYGNNTFVAVGSLGTILTSPDGVTWTKRTSDTNTKVALTGVAYGVADGKNTFVAVGLAGTILTSLDGGGTWTQTASLGTTYPLSGVAYGNNTFVAVGGGVSAKAVTSPNGMGWIPKDLGVKSVLNGVTYGNGTFVAVGNGGAVLTSLDGATWTQRSSGTTDSLNGVTCATATFVAVGSAGTIVTSPDGVTWTKRNSGTTNPLSGIAYGNSTFVAVGSSGAILTSPDGVTWTQRNSGTTDSLNGIAYGNSTFVAVGLNGTIVTSPDGVTWTLRNSGVTDGLYGVTYGNGTFVAVGGSDFSDTILTSPDGVTWTLTESGVTDGLNGVTYGNGTFVAVGLNGTIVTSPDGVTWTLTDSGVTDGLYGVTYGNGTFVAVTDIGFILTSSDGNSWESRDPGGPDYPALYGVTYGNNTFVAVGDSGTILTSSNGISWQTRDSGTTNALYGATYGNSTFVTVGTGGTILTSSDGITWTRRDPGVTDSLYGATYGNGTFVAVGDHGTILQSDNTLTPVNGECGAANGQASTTAPTTNLCTTGTASAVSGSGPWTWSCAGTNGGTTASCSASLKTWTVSPSAGSNGTISPATATPVANGATASFTVTPAAGYTAAVGGTCGGSPASGTAAFTYTTSPIIAPCSVVATFTLIPFDGECGAANGGTLTAAPTTDLCAAGTPSAVNGTGPWTWSCAGSNGRLTANCSANVKTWTASPSAGSNGTISPATATPVANGATASFTVTPAAGYTAAVGGTCGGSPASGTAAFTYTTSPIITDCTVVATFTQIVNGECGAANGQASTTAPTTNLCTTGTASAVSGSGPWTWSCAGTNGGTTASCSASLKTWAVSPSAGSNGTISPATATPVANGATASFTVTPAAGYTAAVGGTCGGSPASGTAAFTYTTSPIITDCTVVATFTQIVNGECGAANGQASTTAPTTNLCTTGTASAVSGSGPWTWSCAGTNGGTTASCSASLKTWAVSPSAGSNGTISPATATPVANGATASFTVTPAAGYTAAVGGTCGGSPASGTAAFTYTTSPIITDCTVVATFTQIVNGECGAANGQASTTAPTTNLCTTGTASAVSGSGPWTWSCAGTNGGTTASCSASLKTWAVSPSAGSNGTISPATATPVANGATASFTVTPAAGYTAAVGGTCGGSPASGTAAFTYTTSPIITDCTVVATFTQIVNGECGAANGQASTTAPTTNLCTTGTASAVSGSGPWTWSCAGTNGGTTASCSASLKTWAVSPSAGSNGTISPATATPVANGATASFTVTPAAGYTAAVGGTCGGSPASGTAAFTYTTSPIITDCTVVATFTQIVNGECGAANGQASTTAPTTNLCTTGTASAVSGSGPWTWSCAGTNGGTTASCSASLKTWAVSPSAGSNGTISPATATPVANGATASFTVTPAAGYTAAVGGTCGGSPASGTAAFTYTTSPIITDCTVVATFTQIVNGECGAANGQASTTAPTTNLCTTGTASAVSGSGPWTWSCAGTNGGTTASCSASLKTWAVSPSAGSNGTISPATATPVANGATASFTVTPAAGYTAAVGGTCGGSPASGTAAFTYTTSPIITDCTVVATFTQIVNGECGAANGQASTTAPTTNLCTTGTASAVSGSGPWTWSCAGTNGGTTASCSASLQGDVNGDGNVDCADLVIIKSSFGKRRGQPGFDARADVNEDGIVDIRDLSAVSRKLQPGTICP